MAGSLFDWDDREKPKVYDFGGNLSSLNMKDGRVIHSRTGFSKRDMNGGRSFSAGYQMYFDGYLRFVTTVDTQWDILRRGIRALLIYTKYHIQSKRTDLKHQMKEPIQRMR